MEAVKMLVYIATVVQSQTALFRCDISLELSRLLLDATIFFFFKILFI